MRLAILATSVLILLSASADAMAQERCPDDANKASLAVWPGGAVRTGRTVTAKHPCGRQLSCVGGRQGSSGIPRNCRWL
jgi:hypothetical protein